MVAGQVPGPRHDVDRACLLLSCCDRLTHQSKDTPLCRVITNPHDKSWEGHSRTYWVAWSSTPRCIPHTKWDLHPTCRAKEGCKCQARLGQLAAMAARACPLTLWLSKESMWLMICMRSSGRMLFTLSCSGRQGGEASELPGSGTEIAEAERACPEQILAHPRPLLYPGATTAQISVTIPSSIRKRRPHSYRPNTGY